MATDRIRALVALAVDNPDSEESRTAAVRACIEIHRSGMLGEATTKSPLPRFEDLDLNDIDAVREFNRIFKEQEAAWHAAYGKQTKKVRWSRRVFCFRCKSIVEGNEESVQHSTVVNGRITDKYECLMCFDKVETTKLAAAPAERG